MSTQTPVSYHCPNCGKDVAERAPACATCGASFEGLGWKPLKPGETYEPARDDSPPGIFYKACVVLGVGFLIATVLPVGAYIVQATLGSILNPSFRKISPAVYYVVSMGLNYLPAALVVGVCFRRFSVFQRVPYTHRSPVLFGLGTSLIILYLFARVVASTVPGGGAGFAVASFSPFVLWPALLMLGIGSAKLLIGIGRSRANPSFQPTATGGG